MLTIAGGIILAVVFLFIILPISFWALGFILDLLLRTEFGRIWVLSVVLLGIFAAIKALVVALAGS